MYDELRNIYVINEMAIRTFDKNYFVADRRNSDADLVSEILSDMLDQDEAELISMAHKFELRA